MFDAEGMSGDVPESWRAQNALNDLWRAKILDFGPVAITARDDRINKTTCRVQIAIRLPPSDRSAIARRSAIRIKGLEPPPDLLGDSPATTIGFFVQGDHKHEIVGIEDGGEAANAVIFLALNRDLMAMDQESYASAAGQSAPRPDTAPRP